MKAGILTQILSPEGVFTTFDYEVNRHGKSIEWYMDGHKSDTIFYTGGLRIQKITEMNFNNNGLSKTRFFHYRAYKFPDARSTRSIEYSGDGWGIPKVGLSERDYCVEQRLLKINPTTGASKKSAGCGHGLSLPYRTSRSETKLGIVSVCNGTDSHLFDRNEDRIHFRYAFGTYSAEVATTRSTPDIKSDKTSAVLSIRITVMTCITMAVVL